MTFHHDLTPAFTPTTAALIRDAWITWRDGTDPQPIRDAYRATQHQGVRDVVAGIMTSTKRKD